MKDNWDKYFIDDTDVLKNNLGITNKEELFNKEKEISFEKLTELYVEPVKGNFDIKHLKDIHKYIFSSIYPFAGEFRDCTMAKTTRGFYDPFMIEDELKKELDELNKNVGNVISIEYYAHLLANLYYQLMTIHPFREGNGRSVREFIREFVEYHNKDLPFYCKFDQKNMDKELSLKAVEYHFIYPSLLEEEFKKALVVKKKENSL